MRRTLLVLLMVGSALWLQAQNPPTPLPAARDATFYVFGDPQEDVGTESSGGTTYWTNMVNDAITKASTYHPGFALLLGDFTNNHTTGEFATAKTGLDALDAAGIPAIIVSGNHDVYSATSNPEWEAFASGFLTGKSYFLAAEDGRYLRLTYEVTLGNRPLLILAGNPCGCESNAQITAGLNWLSTQKTAWLSTHPGGKVWLITHQWWRADGSTWDSPLLQRNWAFADADADLLFAGHYGQNNPHWNYTETAKTAPATGVLRQVDIDYQSSTYPPPSGHSIYTIWRVTRTGVTQGCAYGLYGVTPTPSGTADWLGTDHCAAFDFAWPDGITFSGVSLSGVTVQ